MDEQGRIVILKAGEDKRNPASADRFERVRGRATVKWKPDELMHLLRDKD